VAWTIVFLAAEMMDATPCGLIYPDLLWFACQSQETLYYSVAAPFFVFYLLFDVVIYPMRDFLHPNPTAVSPYCR
jgi:ATP/ADP translocase